MAIDNIDRFGHCAVCHRNMITEKVIDGRVQQVFKPEHGHAEFLLNNGSRMRVCMCLSCREKVNLDSEKVHGYIMDAVIKGWQLEVDALVADEKHPEWTEERGREHMEKYSSLEIDCYSDGLATHLLEERRQKVMQIIDEAKGAIVEPDK